MFSVTLILSLSVAVVVCDEILSNYQQIFPGLPPNVSTTNVECSEQFAEFLLNLSNQTLWAYEMMDSSATSANGVLSGYSYQMGNFDTCLQIQAPFATKYCLVEIRAEIYPTEILDKYSLDHDPYENVFDRIYPWNNKTQAARDVVKLAWCLPAVCTIEDMAESLNLYLNQSGTELVQYRGKIDEKLCHDQNESIEFQIIDLIFVLVLVFLIFMVLWGTIYESKLQQQKTLTNLQRVIVSFSLKKNLQDLGRADTSDSSMMVFYGFRTIFGLTIIVMHEWFTYILPPLSNFDHVEKLYDDTMVLLTFHGDLIVDSIFAMGGIMVVYQLLSMNQTKSVNPGFLIFMRYIRLTPVYAFAIFYYVSILDNLGTGPLWKTIIEPEVQNCKDNWWTNILYLNNYINCNHMCVFHAWYLSCDYHFFIFATFACFIYNKHKKFGFIAFGILLTSSILIPIIITWVYSRPAMIVFDIGFLLNPKSNDELIRTYIKSHMRSAAYFVGMIVGYLYYLQKGTNKRLGQLQAWSILIISIIVMFGCLSGGIVYYDHNHEYNQIEAAIYLGLNRPAFALASLAFFYVASYGFTTLRQILSWKAFIPLSKLTYSAYIIHLHFILMSLGSTRIPRYFSYMNLFTAAFAHMIMGYSVALLLYLLIEAPIRRIVKVYMTRNKQKTEINSNISTLNGGTTRI